MNFINQKNKLKFVWNLSQETANQVSKEKDKQKYNDSNLIRWNNKSNYISKSTSVSSEWVDMNTWNWSYADYNYKYIEFEVEIPEIHKDRIIELRSKIVIDSSDTLTSYTLFTTAVSESKTYQIIDTEEEDIKRVILRHSFLINLKTMNRSLKAKHICYLIPLLTKMR